jgi:hypothetical protein
MPEGVQWSKLAKERPAIDAKTMGGRIAQCALLRDEPAPPEATVVVRGGSDTRAKLHRHVERTARAWSLDGLPFFRACPDLPSLDSSCCQLAGALISPSGCFKLPTARWIVCSRPSVTSAPLPSTL